MIRDDDDPSRALADLAGATTPWLFGVRHHSPACAVALPPLLDALAPDHVAVELPADLAPWLEWLAHEEAEAPLAVAAVSSTGEDLGFYPFADFSPELVALRWARARGVPVHAIDLPAGRRGGRMRRGEVVGIHERLGDWDELVEGAATLAEPERVRRAGLLFGWALRVDAARAGGVSEVDRARETYMREALGKLRGRVAAIVGAFHCPALIGQLWEPALPGEPRELVSSLIPYGFELLDDRSGYPAGIRDPMWQQRLWQTQQGGGDVAGLVAQILVEITRGVRRRGLPASVPDAHAAAEVALSLARLRRLAAPGRRELVEAVQTALTHGELLGRGRVVAQAMHDVLVGSRRGHLAAATPRSGLGPHVTALLAELRLPHAQMTEPEDVRLDPLRSPIDRRRHVAMCRLRACGVPYATEIATRGVGGVEGLTTTWQIMFTPATDALVELAGLRGVTLRQAASGALRAERQRRTAADALTAGALIELTAAAAEAGCGDLVTDWLDELCGPRLLEATLPQLIALLALIDRIAAGHVVGLPAEGIVEVDTYAPPARDRARVLEAAVASVLGLAGSEQVDDARSLAELVRVVEVGGRLRWSIGELLRTGTPLIVGAASVVQVQIGDATPEALGESIGAWLDAAVDADGRRSLAARLRGAIVVAGPLFEAAPIFLESLLSRVERLSDEDFLPRAHALRDGFDVLSTASRKRLLRILGERMGDARLDLATSIAPARMAAAAEADAAGRAAMERV